MHLLIFESLSSSSLLPQLATHDLVSLETSGLSVGQVVAQASDAPVVEAFTTKDLGWHSIQVVDVGHFLQPLIGHAIHCPIVKDPTVSSLRNPSGHILVQAS